VNTSLMMIASFRSFSDLSFAANYCACAESGTRLEDVVRLELDLEGIADLLVPVLRDFRDTDGVCDLLVTPRQIAVV
jgi:hypothetical protein